MPEVRGSLCCGLRTVQKKSSAYVPHIRVLQSPVGPYIRLCKHCEDAPCVDACIGESLQRGPNGLVIQDEERCIGCFMCNMVCPHGAMKTLMSQEKAFKCTLMCGTKSSPPACSPVTGAPCSLKRFPPIIKTSVAPSLRSYHENEKTADNT